MKLGSDADVSEEHAASILRVVVSGVKITCHRQADPGTQGRGVTARARSGSVTAHEHHMLVIFDWKWKVDIFFSSQFPVHCSYRPEPGPGSSPYEEPTVYITKHLLTLITSVTEMESLGI